MPAVTQRIDNYLGGVSRQSDDKKLPGQVRECLNGYPDPTFGLTKRPGFKWIANLGTGTTYDASRWFFIARDDTNKYIGCITPKPNAGPHGSIAIWNATTGAACTVTENGTDYDYLTGDRSNYHILNLQDTSIITNNAITVAKQADPAFTANKQATLVLSGTTISNTYTTIINGVTISTTTDSDDTYADALTKIKNDIDSQNTSSGWGITTTSYQSSLYLSRATAFTISATGGATNDSISVFQDQVDNITQLPAQTFDGQTVKVINTASDKDTYFAKFIADNGTSGPGYWGETKDPAKSPGLDAATMPHELVNTGTNAFTFRAITWNDRTAGDDVTNEHPRFVGYKIQQSFFHNNRLGFLSEDNVSMSQSGKDNRFNFYHTSAQIVTDADPVDLSCSTIRPAALHAVIPTTQGLVLFSKNQQFLMSSADGVLTPTTTTIRTISNYEVDTEVDPVDIGTNINFVSKTPSYTRIFGMATRGQDENPQVVDVGRIVNEWVPATVDTFIASAQDQFLALSSQSSNKIYFYRTYSDGETNLVQAWFNWQLPGNVQAIAVESDDFFTVTKQGTQFTLSKASLSQSPEDAIIVNNDGQKINPCIDLYAEASNVAGNNKVDYDAVNDFSKCYIPWDNIATLTPVLIIKGTTATGQFIESGFTTTPEVVTNDGDPYFKVPKKNLISVEDDVIVGWKYDFDITLPKTYYRTDDQQTRTDFTANLTVARMKFAVGLSGVMSFKLKSTGIRQGKKTYTQDADTYDWPFIDDDLSFVDRDQVKVKINNIETTGFTFANDTTITLSSIPSQTFTTQAGQHTFTWTFDRTDNSKIKVLLETAVNSNPETYTTQVEGTNYVIGEGKNVIFIDGTGTPTAVTTGKKVKIYSADDILIYLDEWYNLDPTVQANTYLANDIALADQSVFTLPIHQRTDNFQIRLFNDSPFPVSLNSMMWEGTYSPKFYRRAT
tara:strand:+ start:3432 stop:6290 length:2859 start_codon:yes stop_codon:yes gene_type:complete